MENKFQVFCKELKFFDFPLSVLKMLGKPFMQITENSITLLHHLLLHVHLESFTHSISFKYLWNQHHRKRLSYWYIIMLCCIVVERRKCSIKALVLYIVECGAMEWVAKSGVENHFSSQRFLNWIKQFSSPFTPLAVVRLSVEIEIYQIEGVGEVS